jgi:hypothetical protein
MSSKKSPQKSPKKMGRPSTAVTRTVTLKMVTDYETQNHLTAVEVENESLRTRLYALEE